MAGKVDEMVTREQKAWRKVVAAAKKLAAKTGNVELGEAVATATHNDPGIREMRRSEALAALLEVLVVVVAEDDEPVKATKVTKSDEPVKVVKVVEDKAK